MGQTVSGWIRDLVEREVRLRLPRSPGTQPESVGSYEVRPVLRTGAMIRAV